jgi:hypothetical protein
MTGLPGLFHTEPGDPVGNPRIGAKNRARRTPGLSFSWMAESGDTRLGGTRNRKGRSRMTARRALWIVIGTSAALRLVWGASLGAYANEAYYALYARHLDWGFFDHPPMVGVVAAAGLKLAGGLAPILGLRLGFIVLFAGSSWLLARLTARAFGAPAGVLAVLALNATVYYGMRIGTFAEPDGPLLFFWLLTLDRLWAALDVETRGPAGTGLGAWIGTGLAWGGALLSKYHAILLPVGAGLYLLLRPAARRCLRTPGPYLALAVGLTVFAPVIDWNSRHGWSSFVYQGTRAGGFAGFQPEMLIEALVGQVLYLTPWIWARLVGELVSLVRRGRGGWSAAEAFLTSQAAPVLALFLGVSTFRRIMPHWPMIGFVALMPLLGRTWAGRLASGRGRYAARLAALTAAPVLLASLIVVHARTGLFQDERGRLLGLFAPSADPTVDTIRWDQIARDLAGRGLLEDPRLFLFTDSWRYSAELALAIRRSGGPPVACYHRDARSFTFWSRPEDWVGRDGLYVRLEDAQAQAEDYLPWFTRVEPLAVIPILRAGVTLETVYLYRCVRQTAPYAFGYDGPGPIPPPGLDPGVDRPRLGQHAASTARH